MIFDQDNLSICFTLKNRSEMLDKKLTHLKHQNYDMRKIQICIADGGSTDQNHLMEVITKHVNDFHSICYQYQDRNKLPFKILSNNPAVDRNCQITSQPSFEKIIMTDPEVLFQTRNELRFISDELSKNIYTLISYRAIFVQEPCEYDTNNLISLANYNGKKTWKYDGLSALVLALNKSAFIENKGFEEEFSQGFAGEDDAFINWYRTNKKVITAPSYVIHNYHPTQWTPENNELRERISLPLLRKMQSQNLQSNWRITDDSWMRHEMIVESKIYYGGIK